MFCSGTLSSHLIITWNSHTVSSVWLIPYCLLAFKCGRSSFCYISTETSTNKSPDKLLTWVGDTEYHQVRYADLYGDKRSRRNKQLFLGQGKYFFYITRKSFTQSWCSFP